MNLSKEEALTKIEELKTYIANLNQEEEFVKIDYSVIPKEIFDLYGAKPFEIMKRKMRKDEEVWNNINFYDAKKEAKKLGWRLPMIQEMLTLFHAYKKNYPDNASVCHKEFLGIKELSYDESVFCEWIDAPSPFLRGGDWYGGANAGVFTLDLADAPSGTGASLGFRCCR